MSVFIIAEAGVNHNGSIDLAKKLIDVASNAGADAVKFQSFKADNLATKNAQKAMYQKETTNIDTNNAVTINAVANVMTINLFILFSYPKSIRPCILSFVVLNPFSNLFKFKSIIS